MQIGKFHLTDREFAFSWLKALPTVSLHSLALNRQLTGKQSPSTFLLSNLHETDKEGKTLLHWAAEKGDEEILRILLEKGGDPNVKDTSGQTPKDYYPPLAAWLSHKPTTLS